MKSQRAYVEHVPECVEKISTDSASGRDAVFRSHTLQDAIVCNVQVLCESVRRIDAVYKNEHSEIDWKAIAGMRNVLVHDYFDVDFEAVWDVVTRDFPLDLIRRAEGPFRSVRTGNARQEIARCRVSLT